jgi:adenylate cyclase
VRYPFSSFQFKSSSLKIPEQGTESKDLFMQMEIERKFLVKGDSWRQSAGTGQPCKQGYLAASADVTVRVRKIRQSGFLTVKGPTSGISRMELEYEIPIEDAEVMLKTLCGGRTVEKIRYRLESGGARWEIDQFSGANDGLILAEIELPTEEHIFEKPDWLGKEVSHDPRYFNAALAETPFCLWGR